MTASSWAAKPETAKKKKELNMKTLNLALLMVLALLAAPSGAGPLGTALTYQGRLADSGGPASGNYDLQFILRDAANGGNEV